MFLRMASDTKPNNFVPIASLIRMVMSFNIASGVALLAFRRAGYSVCSNSLIQLGSAINFVTIFLAEFLTVNLLVLVPSYFGFCSLFWRAFVNSITRLATGSLTIEFFSRFFYSAQRTSTGRFQDHVTPFVLSISRLG